MFQGRFLVFRGVPGALQGVLGPLQGISESFHLVSDALQGDSGTFGLKAGFGELLDPTGGLRGFKDLRGGGKELAESFQPISRALQGCQGPFMGVFRGLMVRYRPRKFYEVFRAILQ